MWGLGSESQNPAARKGGSGPLPKTKLWTVSFAKKLRGEEHLDGVDPVKAGNAMYEVGGGCLIDLREGGGEASTRKLEIEPPGLEFTCAIANSARSRLRRVLGAVDKMDRILGVPVQIHG